MKHLPPYAAGLIAVLLAASVSGSAIAGQSLEQIRYALFKEPSASVEGDLRLLAAKGDLASQHLLANVLAADPAQTREAVTFYKNAFADGRGEIAALASMARLMDRNPRLRLENRDFFRAALRRFAQTRDM